MDPNEQARWARRLRPIRLDLVAEGFSVDRQLATRSRITLVASILFGGIALFFVLVFGAFEQVGIGLVVAAPLAVVVGWLWWRQVRLTRLVADYREALVTTAAQG